MPRAIKCPCGDNVCESWLVEPQAAMQGVNFTEQEARAVVDTLERLNWAQNAIFRRVSIFNHAVKESSRLSGVSEEEIVSDSRKSYSANARQYAMWLCREIQPNFTNGEIGRLFGRDKTTVNHAIRKIDEQKKATQPSSIGHNSG